MERLLRTIEHTLIDPSFTITHRHKPAEAPDTYTNFNTRRDDIATGCECPHPRPDDATWGDTDDYSMVSPPLG